MYEVMHIVCKDQAAGRPGMAEQQESAVEGQLAVKALKRAVNSMSSLQAAAEREAIVVQAACGFADSPVGAPAPSRCPEEAGRFNGRRWELERLEPRSMLPDQEGLAARVMGPDCKYECSTVLRCSAGLSSGLSKFRDRAQVSALESPRGEAWRHRGPFKVRRGIQLLARWLSAWMSERPAY